MRGLDPRIHRKDNFYSKVMDCRVKPGNDDAWVNIYEAWCNAFSRGRWLLDRPHSRAMSASSSPFVSMVGVRAM